MSNLSKYGFTEFSENTAVKEKFLQNVENGLSEKQILMFPGLTLPVPFPDVPVAPGFYNEDDTVSSHEEKFPKYHETIFPMMESIANAVSLPVTSGVVPPFVDPTQPIMTILAELQFPDFELNFETDILPKLQEFIDALKDFPEDWKPLYDLMLEIPDLPVNEKELKEKLREMQERFPPTVPEFNFPPTLNIPTPPFIDIPEFVIPNLSLPNVGIIDLILKLINAAVTAVFQIIDDILRNIKNFISKIAQGIKVVVEFLIEKIFNILEPVLEEFQNLLAQLGWISTIGTIIKYIIGMIIVTIIAFFLGPGLIADGVAKFLGLN